MLPTAVYAKDGYATDRGLTGWYRDLTCTEAKLGLHHQLYAFAEGMGLREVRLNGAPKTWKRSPGVVLSLMYGRRDFFKMGSKELESGQSLSTDLVRLLVPVRMAFTPETPEVFVTDWIREREINPAVSAS